MVAAVTQMLRGIGAALRAEPRIAWATAAAVCAFSLIAPVAVLSLARRPADSFTVNPWLSRLPEYLASGEPLARKLSFLSGAAIAWVSADEPGAGVEWSFVLDVPTLARILLTAALCAAFFSLCAYGASLRSARAAGVAGAMTSVAGLTTGPCTLAGCGAPVLPVVGLAFTGLESGTLAALSTLSQASAAIVLSAMSVAVLWLGFRAGVRSTLG